MYTLINAAFDRSRTVFLLLLFLLASGVVAYINIPKESEPDVPIPIIYVSMSHDGISPDDAERLLIKPMEKELQTISGVKEMSSTASEGHASVLLEFDAGFDGDIHQCFFFVFSHHHHHHHHFFTLPLRDIRWLASTAKPPGGPSRPHTCTSARPMGNHWL